MRGARIIAVKMAAKKATSTNTAGPLLSMFGSLDPALASNENITRYKSSGAKATK